jgi:threonine/homoserine/homoserine lactone efflux protein
MWTYVFLGTVLGLSAGISPGPLLALVISQTLRHNTAEGVRVAAAPLLTDLPIILLGMLAFSALPNPNSALGIVSFLGSLFVGYLGVTSLLQGPIELQVQESEPRSYLKGALVNALSPHPYLFWFSVGVPTIVKASQHSTVGAVGFVGAFYICLVGTKVVVALLVGRSRDFLSGAPYLWTMRLLGILLVGFAVLLFYEGITLTGVVRR